MHQISFPKAEICLVLKQFGDSHSSKHSSLGITVDFFFNVMLFYELYDAFNQAIVQMKMKSI